MGYDPQSYSAPSGELNYSQALSHQFIYILKFIIW